MAHPFDGYRVYDGQPDDTMQARLDTEAALLIEINKTYPQAIASYFPVEGKWLIHSWGYALSDMFANKGDALTNALKRLQELNQNK